MAVGHFFASSFIIYERYLCIYIILYIYIYAHWNSCRTTFVWIEAVQKNQRQSMHCTPQVHSSYAIVGARLPLQSHTCVLDTTFQLSYNYLIDVSLAGSLLVTVFASTCVEFVLMYKTISPPHILISSYSSTSALMLQSSPTPPSPHSHYAVGCSSPWHSFCNLHLLQRKPRDYYCL